MAIIYDPNLDFQVIDASIPEDEYETPSIDTSLGALFATFSSRGIHNKIVECRTSSLIKTTFGDDFGNWDKYGQVNLQALRLAKSGGRAFICSLIPEDAKVAYSVFGVSVANVDNIPVYERADTELSLDGTSIVNFGKGAYVLDTNGNKKQVKLKAAAGDSEATVLATTTGAQIRVETKDINYNNMYFDSDGNPTGFDGSPILSNDGEISETFYPLFAVYYYSRGKGGNFFGYKISRNTSRDKKAVDGRRYTIKFYELLSTGSYKSLYGGEEFDFSFNPDAVYSSVDTTSEALKNVYINIDEKGEKKPMQLIVYDNFNSIVNAINDAGGNEESDKVLVDILNGIFQNGNPYNKLVLADDSIDIGNTIITLDNGNDGSIDESLYSAESVAKTKEELLVKFFSCDVDDDIFDEKIVDADVLADANYSDVVKQTIMATFSVYRPDIFLGIDLGLVTSVEEAIAKYRELNSYVNTDYAYMCAFFGHSGYLNDKAIDGSAREITCTYDWLGGMADNFATGNGAFQMHAGASRGKVKYIIPHFVCKKNKANDIETLEDYGINNIQYINKNKDLVYMLESTQYTVETSKLMSIRNALVIGRLIRMCAGILPYYKYDERNIDDTLSAAKDALVANVTLARIPSTIKVNFDLYQTKADKKEENAHCAIEVQFPDYVKKFHVVITAKRQEKKD